MLLQQEWTFPVYGLKVIRERLHKMLTHARCVRTVLDVDEVHDTRVASRRLRAAIAVFREAFPFERFREFSNDVRNLTRSLSAAREMDVLILDLSGLTETLPPRQQGEMK